MLRVAVGITMFILSFVLISITPPEKSNAMAGQGFTGSSIAQQVSGR